MSVYNDKQREEIKKAKLKQEQEATEPKSIYDIKTIDELLEYYYLIPKIVEIDNYKGLDIKELLEQITLKTRKPTNINLVRRGRMKKKLTEKQIEEIKASNKTNAELGKIYNVSASTISAVKNNKY